VQFLLFLLIGVMLYVYYTQHAPGEIAAFTLDGGVQTDRIFPYFIVRTCRRASSASCWRRSSRRRCRRSRRRSTRRRPPR
jgi:hypothetical protein